MYVSLLGHGDEKKKEDSIWRSVRFYVRPPNCVKDGADAGGNVKDSVPFMCA